MELITSKTFKHEHKCLNCGKGESQHRSSDKACPVGGTFPSWLLSEPSKFVDSGKPTIKSKRQYATLVDQENRLAATKAAFEEEKSKVRAMTYEEVVTAVCEMLTEKTGLGIIVERDRGHDRGHAEIHLTTEGGRIRLGYTTVTQYSNGSYGVGGTSAGCFMANHSDRDIRNVLYDDLRAIEEKANKEKQ